MPNVLTTDKKNEAPAGSAAAPVQAGPAAVSPMEQVVRDIEALKRIEGLLNKADFDRKMAELIGRLGAA